MPLSGYQIQLIQSSFETFVVDIDQAAALFYSRVFEIDPALRPMFRNDMHIMGRKLMQTLVFAVNALNSLEEIGSQMRVLGKRHTLYGVKQADFVTIGEALFWTLKKVLGEAYTPEVDEAWRAMYQILAESAIEGAFA